MRVENEVDQKVEWSEWYSSLAVGVHDWEFFFKHEVEGQREDNDGGCQRN